MRVFWDPVQARHAPRFFLQRGQVRHNYEIPARAGALLAGCRALGLDPEPPPCVPRRAIERVHAAEYLDFLRDAPPAWARLPGAGSEMVPNIHPVPEMAANGARFRRTGASGLIAQLGWFTTDTSCPVAVETWPAAAAAAACALAAADEAASGRSAYALTRPPGHHAYPSRAGGHCYLNNAALAADRLCERGAKRVAILDLDSHHGNGTQGIFWERSDVLFVSIHGDPSCYYPWYVGYADERGGGSGEGYTLNLPLAEGTGNTGWLDALDTGLMAIRAYQPDALVVSLGFDASESEPLGFLRVSSEGFARAGEQVSALRLPTAVIQEGGYNVDALAGLLARFLGALL